MYKNISENLKISLCYQGLANAVACDVINMELYNHGAFVVIHTGANDTDLTLTLYEASSVTPSNTAAITTAVPIYIDINAGTSSDVVSATTSAYSYAIDPGTENGLVLIFEIDPTILTAGKPCVYLADSGGNSGNYCTILFVGEPKEKGATLPAAISQNDDLWQSRYELAGCYEHPAASDRHNWSISYVDFRYPTTRNHQRAQAVQRVWSCEAARFLPGVVEFSSGSFLLALFVY